MFEILEIIDAGAFATVAVARNLETGRTSALKVVNTTHLQNPKVINRTRDEARILSLLAHPNIVRVESLLAVDHRPVVVMERVEGLSLEMLLELRRGGIPPGVAVEVCRCVISALNSAWAATDWTGSPLKIIHRDIKPSNVLLSVHGAVKVVDFGIAHGEFAEKESETVTQLLGARAFMAPERLDGAPDTPAGDLFSVGLLLYCLLSGRRLDISLHRAQYAQLRAAQLERLAPEGLTPPDAERLRWLIGRLTEYDTEQRPDHAAAETLLLDFQQLARLDPDLTRFAVDPVAALWRQRAVVRPADHPRYREVAFLEHAREVVRQPLPGPRQDECDAADARVRRLLEVEGWHLDAWRVRRVLAENPLWTAAPFLERIDRTERRWWQFWRADPVSAAELATVLDVLKARPTPGTLERARVLSNHPDPTVSRLARELLERIG